MALASSESSFSWMSCSSSNTPQRQTLRELNINKGGSGPRAVARDHSLSPFWLSLGVAHTTLTRTASTVTHRPRFVYALEKGQKTLFLLADACIPKPGVKRFAERYSRTIAPGVDLGYYYRRGCERLMKNVDYTPRLIFCEVTKGSNLRCIHCRATATELSSPNDLPTTKFDNASLSVIPTNLVLSGGEPLFRPDIFDLEL